MSVVNVPQVAGVAEKDNIIYESFQRIIDQANSGFDSTNTNITTITGSLTAVPAGYVMYGTGTIAVGYDSNLRWDPTNHWLGIGTTPGTILETRATGAPSFTRVVTVPGQQGAINIGLTGTGSRTAGDGPSLLMFGDNAAGTFSYMGRISSRWVNPAAGSESTCVTLSVRANSADAAVQTEAVRIFPSTKVSIGTTSERQQLSVNGMIESMASGYKFPDATTQATAGVLPTRTISTTLPLTGGGDLSANRTLAINSFAGSAAGAVPTSLGGTANYLRADGSWATPPGTFTLPATAGVVWTDGGGGAWVNANFKWLDASQRLAIGATSANYKLDVTGSGGNNIDIRCNGQYASGDSSLLGAFIAVNGYNTPQAAFGQDTSTTAGLWGTGYGWAVRYKLADGMVGVGTAPSGSGYRLTVANGVEVSSGNLLVSNGNITCGLFNSYYVAGAQVVTTRQPGVGAALVSRTAGATYGGTERTMLQEAHDRIRTLLVALRTHGLIS